MICVDVAQLMELSSKTLPTSQCPQCATVGLLASVRSSEAFSLRPRQIALDWRSRDAVHVSVRLLLSIAHCLLHTVQTAAGGGAFQINETV